jgi:polyhydroxyalkanoate synthesis regulator protein
MRIITYYIKNRRLYDTQESHHTTHRAVVDLICSGEQVQVVDKATREDMTACVLLRALADIPGAAEVIGANTLRAYIQALAGPIPELPERSPA